MNERNLVEALWDSIGVPDQFNRWAWVKNRIEEVAQLFAVRVLPGGPLERKEFLLSLAREAGAAAGKAYAEASKPAPHPLVGKKVEVVPLARFGVVDSANPQGGMTVAFDDGTAEMFWRPSLRILPEGGA